MPMADHTYPRKPSILPVEEVLRWDKRPPVFYLRSFELDSFTSREQIDASGLTPEEVLVQVLEKVGPCVAVGNPPGREIAHGFPRFTFGDDWRERVEELIKQSALVVHCTGASEGLLWELERVAELVVPRSNLILIVTTTVTEKWWELADTLFGRMPRFNVPPPDEFPYVGVIYFDKVGKPQRKLIFGFNKPARVIIEEAFDPLFHQMNISPRPEFHRWLSCLCYRLSNSRLFSLIRVFLPFLLLGLSEQCRIPQSDIPRPFPMI
jgi:hypothetical protein